METINTPRYQIVDRITGETIETENLAIYCIQNVLGGSQNSEPAQPPIVQHEEAPVFNLNWQGLLSSLRGSSLFAKVYAAAKTDLAVNVAYTLILATLNSAAPVEADLVFAVREIITAMGELLTPEDIEQAEALFLEYGFAIA